MPQPSKKQQDLNPTELNIMATKRAHTPPPCLPPLELFFDFSIDGQDDFDANSEQPTKHRKTTEEQPEDVDDVDEGLEPT